MSKKSELQLKILGAYTRDIGRVEVRRNYDSRDTLNVSTDDVVEIKGRTRTVVNVKPLYPSDEGKGIARIDDFVRQNSGTKICSHIWEIK